MGKIKIIRVVIDTNVLVSALLFGGIPGELIPLWKNKRILPLLSDSILDEYLHVLAYPKFRLTEKEIRYLLYHEILPWFDIVSVSAEFEIIIADDPTDDKFLHCARAGKADTIISGDQHLLTLHTYNEILIVNPVQFIDQI